MRHLALQPVPTVGARPRPPPPTKPGHSRPSARLRNSKCRALPDAVVRRGFFDLGFPPSSAPYSRYVRPRAPDREAKEPDVRVAPGAPRPPGGRLLSTSSPAADSSVDMI